MLILKYDNVLHASTKRNEQFIGHAQEVVTFMTGVLLNVTGFSFHLKGRYSGIITTRTTPPTVLNEEIVRSTRCAQTE